MPFPVSAQPDSSLYLIITMDTTGSRKCQPIASLLACYHPWLEKTGIESILVFKTLSRKPGCMPEWIELREDANNQIFEALHASGTKNVYGQKKEVIFTTLTLAARSIQDEYHILFHSRHMNEKRLVQLLKTAGDFRHQEFEKNLKNFVDIKSSFW